MKTYNSNVNYIGNAPYQKKYTKIFYKKCSTLNYSAFCHDNLYVLLFNERNFLNQVILKVLFDLVFLLLGLTRSIFKLQPQSVIPIILCYLILLITTFYPPVWRPNK